MRIFDYENGPEELLTPEVVRLLTQVHEHRGRQMVLLEQYGDRLIALRTEAERQSGRAADPRDSGYRVCLEEIREHFDVMEAVPETIRALYCRLFAGSDGAYRQTEAVISEIDPWGEERERFFPCAADEIEESVTQLCGALQNALAENRHDPLILIARFVLDFLSIHPFEDGNGRLVWLLQTLLLYRAGYYVSAYVSLERLIEQSEQDYKTALQYSSIFWQDGTNSYEPFLRYFLRVLTEAYERFEKQTGFLTGARQSKSDRLRETILAWEGPVTKRALLEQYPDIAVVTVERTLAAMLKEGLLRKTGGGRSTAYVKAKKEN
ncbi:MAG: Fic family protein [Eubacterium sp.]|nr:Fic family protein [Eubacterium sp.]